MNQMDPRNMSSVIIRKTWGADDYFICGSPLPITSRGIWSGDSPLNSIFPVFILQAIAGTIVSRVVYMILRPMRQSKFLCSVLGGILLGPSFFGESMKFREKMFPPTEMGVFNSFSTLGAMFALFFVSVKVDYKSLITRAGRNSWVIGFSGTIFPWITLLSLFYMYIDYLPPALQIKIVPFFIASFVSLTFFPVVAYSLDELNILTSELGHLSLSATIVSDLMQWFFVLLVAIFKQANLEQAIEAFVSTFILVLISIYGIRPALVSIIKKTPEGKLIDETYVVLILLGALFMGFTTDFLGSSILYGPIILGFIVPDGPPLGSILVEKGECFVSEFLLPLLFVRVGYELDVRAMGDLRTAFTFMAILFAGYFAKFLGVFLASLSFKLRPRTAFLLGLIMNNKGIIEIVIYFRWKRIKYIDEQTFAVLMFSSLAMTAIIAPFTGMLYKPRVRLASSHKQTRLKTIQTTPGASEFRVITCLHNEENVNSIISLLEASNPTEISPICAYVIHLVDLKGSSVPALIPFNAKQKRIFKLSNSPSSNHILRAFENYSRNSNGPVIVQAFTMIAPYIGMHENICRLALEKLTPLIIIPYHENQKHIEGSLVATSIRGFNAKLQRYAPCTVGMLVDRGTRRMNSSHFSYNVAVIFIGGEDDREALALAARMSGHAEVSLCVLRITLHCKKGGEFDSTNKYKGRDNCKHKCKCKGKSKEGEEEEEEEEELMDEALYDEFKIKNMGNACVVCREVVADCSAQVMDAIQSLESNYDLVMVGRSRHQAMELNDIEMPQLNSKNIEHLGMIGDALVSSELFEGWLSLLVLHRCGRPVHK
ncbi:cation/H(+) antiporter 15-like [Quercus lobata]|uniref:Cation/H+ exchanger domain-containing protein n=1 Tax=Quercus lobata TaxID=97700 RepID=A0A7N2MFS1_QUELO|nr:cation/H(+) antiporter 15-like [Quercus lobata]